MSLWLVRPGKLGEYEETFFTEGRIYLTWTQIQADDLSGIKDADVIFDLLQQHEPDQSSRRLGNWAGQIFAFVSSMAKGDWIAVPRKTKAAIAIGEIEGGYHFDSKAKVMFRHYRTVKWMNVDVPRSAFDPDILQSLAALTTICRIQRNNSEARVMAMPRNGWKMSGLPTAARARMGERVAGDEGIPSDGEFFDLERSGRDQIAVRTRSRSLGLPR